MHGAAHWMALSTMHGGGVVVVQNDPGHLDADDIWSTVEREKINFLIIVGDAFGRPLLDHLKKKSYDLSQFRILLSGGAILTPALKEEFLDAVSHLMIIDGFGASESGGQGQQVTLKGMKATSGNFQMNPETIVLTHDLSARVAPGAGSARATTQDRLAGRLSGDLDAVALKALAWSPADCYPTVAALAEDLRRYLRGESVHALPNKRSAEELVAALARNPNVRVRRRSLERKADGRGADENISADARSTSPGVEDSAVSTTTLRITVQLIGKTDAAPRWAQAYELDVPDAYRTPEGERNLVGALEAALAPFMTRVKRKALKS